MFWRKDKNRKVELSLRRVVEDGFLYTVRKTFLAYKHNDKWFGLVGYEQFKEEIDDLNEEIKSLQKQNQMLIEYLDIRYVPETESKTPAKFEKNLAKNSSVLAFAGATSATTDYVDASASISTLTNKSLTPTKKKMGRPKK